jgi:AcrR family transcriptional regulator
LNTPTEKRIIEASGRLLAEVGPGTFTLEELSKRPEMKGFDVFTLVRNEEQIFEQLLLQLEKELTAIVNDISVKQNSPATEIEMLFKQLHRLFKQKPYYLSVIFDKDLHRQYRGAEEIISRIKGVARGYLTGLIDRGKAQKVFTINAETNVLVKKILGSFQALMNDIQLSNKMVRDLKKYQSATD